MRKEKINGHDIEFYDSIDELSISQFHKYSKYVLVDVGIGSDIASIDGHLSHLISLIGSGDMKKSYREVLNLRRNMYMVMNEQDTKYKGYLCLVHKVDGKVWEDFSEEGIGELYGMLMSEEVRRMADLFGEIKDKIDSELEMYFPSVFGEVAEKNYTILARKKALLQLSSIIDDIDTEKEQESINRQMMAYYTPKNFEGKESEEIKFDKQFETMCLAMSKEFGGMVKGYTVMEFYSAYESLEKQNEELKKLKNRRK